MRVAESIVTLGPMSQVGWARASSTENLGQLLNRAGAERPPTRCKNNPTYLARVAGPHRLEDGAVFAVHGHDLGLFLRGQSHYERTGHNEAFLVGQGHRFSGLQGCPTPCQTGTSDDCRKHHVNLGIACHPGDSLGTDQKFNAFGQTRSIDPAGLIGIGEHDPSRPETAGLLDQQVNVVVGREGPSRSSPPN